MSNCDDISGADAYRGAKQIRLVLGSAEVGEYLKLCRQPKCKAVFEYPNRRVHCSFQYWPDFAKPGKIKDGSADCHRGSGANGALTAGEQQQGSEAANKKTRRLLARTKRSERRRDAPACQGQRNGNNSGRQKKAGTNEKR